MEYQKNNKSAKKQNYTAEEIEIAKSLSSEREERKWTDEDMKKCFKEARLEKFPTGEYFAEIKNAKFIDFDKYLRHIKND